MTGASGRVVGVSEERNKEIVDLNKSGPDESIDALFDGANVDNDLDTKASSPNSSPSPDKVNPPRRNIFNNIMANMYIKNNNASDSSESDGEERDSKGSAKNESEYNSSNLSSSINANSSGQVVVSQSILSLLAGKDPKNGNFNFEGDDFDDIFEDNIEKQLSNVKNKNGGRGASISSAPEPLPQSRTRTTSISNIFGLGGGGGGGRAVLTDESSSNSSSKNNNNINASNTN